MTVPLKIDNVGDGDPDCDLDSVRVALCCWLNDREVDTLLDSDCSLDCESVRVDDRDMDCDMDIVNDPVTLRLNDADGEARVMCVAVLGSVMDRVGRERDSEDVGLYDLDDDFSRDKVTDTVSVGDSEPVLDCDSDIERDTLGSRENDRERDDDGERDDDFESENSSVVVLLTVEVGDLERSLDKVTDFDKAKVPWLRVGLGRDRETTVVTVGVTDLESSLVMWLTVGVVESLVDALLDIDCVNEALRVALLNDDTDREYDSDCVTEALELLLTVSVELTLVDGEALPDRLIVRVLDTDRWRELDLD